MAKKIWWKTVFDKKYIDTYVDTHPPELTERQVKFLVRELHLKKDAKILDLACGFGRHAIPIAKLGFNVTGIDYSKYFIERAASAAKKEGAKVKFLKRDIRKLGFKNKFDVIYCMFTSFGYFETEEEHIKTLKSVYQSLKNRGQFLLDLPNLPAIQERIERYKKNKDGTFRKIFTEELSNDIEIKITSIFDPRKVTMTMKVEWLDEDDREKSYETKVRLFSFKEISRMLSDAKFKTVKVFGDFTSASRGQVKYNPKSPRMIVLARK